jgi:uncharacterized protein
MKVWLLSFLIAFFCVCVTVCHAADEQSSGKAEKLRALIIDGQNNHDWKSTTPLLKKALESSGRFAVDVATSPPTGKMTDKFQPKFKEYDVIVSNYNGEPWPKQTEQDFEAYLTGGGGFVAVHAADNSFADWPAYNRMIGLGGWNGRNEKSGPYVYLDDKDVEKRDESPGEGGHHGQQHPFQIRTRDAEHPIMHGLPQTWMHTKDELYDRLRGPAENMHILATAYSDPKFDGTGRHEPMLMTLDFGNGRVFHTVLGHADYSINCVGFITTLQRGAEWAATGKVAIPVPKDFPTADKSQSIK